jgi:predicted MPP superfamily phosphohydrolase
MARLFGRRPRLFSRRRSIAYLVFVLVCVTILLVSLIVMDNLRIAVRRLDVPIPALSDQAQGYTILHLSDLHGRYFGKNHATLLSAIEGESYDLVVITGDLLDRTSTSKGQQAVLDLVDLFCMRGKPVYFVTGNHDPTLTAADAQGQTVLNPFYAALEAHGAQWVDRPIAVALPAQQTLWLSPMELFYITPQQAQTDVDAISAIDPQTRSLSQQLLLRQSQGVLDYVQSHQEQDLVVALTHYPLTDAQLADFALRVPQSEAVLNQIDLVLCGHYHHGQVRLPLLGALYVPASDQGLHGFFPDESKIYGLVQLDGLTMHISGGMGVSSRFPLRVMATPEITFLRLTRGASQPQ